MSHRKRRKSKSPVQAAREEAQLVVRQEMKTVLHQGPMPSPDVMAKYEQLYPGATEYFFRQLKQQTEHRQALERTFVNSNVKSTVRGQWMAFVLFLVVTILGFAFVWLGFQIVGLITALSGLFSALALFFFRRKRTDEKLAEKV